jgi:hypothetical protein
MKTCTTFAILLAAAALLSPSLAVDSRDLEALFHSNRERRETAVVMPVTSKIQMDDPPHVFHPSRSLEDEFFRVDSAVCYKTVSETPARFCTVDNTPREGTFLVLACPTTSEDYSKCACEIGVGNPEDAPDTLTCNQCNFCKDQSLAFDCRNVATGTCIGFNCKGECISSLEPEEDLVLTDVSMSATEASSAAQANMNLYYLRAVGIVALASSLGGLASLI